MVYDFHTHSLYSDGILLPVELIRYGVVNGYSAIAVADHVSPGNLSNVLRQVILDCEACSRHWGVTAVPAVELTHVPAKGIAELAREAKAEGARIVVVHGETTTEPVEPGTNLAATQCTDVDILAHPGFITPEEARLAVSNGVFLELSARKGHSLTNGHVLKVGRAVGARFLVDSDAHAPGDMLTDKIAQTVARGAGVDEQDLEEILQRNPQLLLSRVKYPLKEC
ncbi:MAG: histidinol phosphate phosphatase domain-containing protein [Chloroflexi bacterium]|nr:histidinol phosphate phosphatase domain-containing protein [Chloroflexota bacterium]